MDRLLEFLDVPEQTFRFEYDHAKGMEHAISWLKYTDTIYTTYNYVSHEKVSDVCTSHYHFVWIRLRVTAEKLMSTKSFQGKNDLIYRYNL